MTEQDPKDLWRQYLAARGQQLQSLAPLHIGVAGSITVDPIEPYLGAYLLGRNFAPKITIGAFNQLRQLCYDYQSVLGKNDIDAIVLLWRIEDMFPEMLERCFESTAGLSELLGELKVLADAIAVLRRSFDGTLIVSTPPYPYLPGSPLLDTAQSAAGMDAFNVLSQFWTRTLGSMERIRLLDLHGLLLHAGMRHAHDARKWHLYRQPYAESFWHDVGRMLGRMIAAEKIGPKKCVVLDLDNTLWGGVVGEDGLAGIQLGDDFPGLAYRSFQQYLLRLKHKGVLLAVASKNNPADALEVFDKHDAMMLSRSDIAVFEIHWDSKVESIKRIAKRLNIGLDSLVFVDDSAKEIAEVAQRLPDVACILVPEELAHLPGFLAETDYFDFAEVTEEDRRRTDLMSAENVREGARENMSEDEFRKSLDLKIEIFRAQKHHLARVTQLINKTNQFNVTTIRRTHDEVAALAGAADTLVLGMDIKDKYGDYGLVGVCILKNENGTGVIDTLLMSCRVLGRGAEATFLANIAEAARALGCHELNGTYIPTPKNGMVADLYSRFNFTHDPGTDRWSLPLTDAPQTPAHIVSALTLTM